MLKVFEVWIILSTRICTPHLANPARQNRLCQSVLYYLVNNAMQDFVLHVYLTISIIDFSI